MMTTLTQALTVFKAEGANAKQTLAWLTDATQPQRTLLMDTHTQEVLACLDGTLPAHVRLEAYQSKGGLVLNWFEGAEAVGFMLPGAQLNGEGFKLAYHGQTFSTYQGPRPKQTDAPVPAQQHIKQAMILGAGLGTRIQPLTESYMACAKPSLPFVGEHTVIGQLVHLLANHGIETIFVNTFFQRDSVMEALTTAGQAAGVTIVEIAEERPTGTAGGLMELLRNGQAYPQFNPNQGMIVLQGDAITTVDLSTLVRTHQSSGAVASIGCQTVRDEDVDKFGICATDAASDAETQTGRIKVFIEKPSLQQAGSYRLANTGFYVIEPALYPHLQAWYTSKLQQEQSIDASTTSVKQFDFATDVFNACLTHNQHLHAIDVPAFWCDIGNPAQFVEALQWAYSKQIEGLNLPSDAEIHRYYDAAGVFYFPHAYERLASKGYRASGGVVFAPLK